MADLVLSSKVELDAVCHALLNGLTNNIFDFDTGNAAKAILKRHFPQVIVKRGIPTTYGKDLKIKA